jgi:hypothetical protein
MLAVRVAQAAVVQALVVAQEHLDRVEVAVQV